MPADNTINQAPSAKHGNGDAPYWCYYEDQPPGPRGASWAVNYGVCRTSLDQLAGRRDHRCPLDCKHRASAPVADQFLNIYDASGNLEAAAYSRRAREDADKNNIQAES